MISLLLRSLTKYAWNCIFIFFNCKDEFGVYPVTSHETLWNNFSFYSNKGIHHMHCIWYGGETLACPLHIPHNDHVFYHNRTSEPPDFLSELTEERNMSTTFSFLMQLMEHMIMVSYFQRLPRVMRDCATLLRKSRLFIVALVILLKAINALHNARSIKPKKILCHHFFDFLDNPYDDISISALSSPPIWVL